jgi:hypothetical protein
MPARNENQVSGFPRDVAAPAVRALKGAGFTQLEQLAQVAEDERMNLHGMGPDALSALRDGLRAKGMSFAKGRRSSEG